MVAGIVCRGIMTSLGLGDLGIQIHEGAKDFSLRNVRTDSETLQWFSSRQ